MTMKNDKAWIGDLLGGPLMSRESRIIAELMLTNPDEQTWQEQIVAITFSRLPLPIRRSAMLQR